MGWRVEAGGGGGEQWGGRWRLVCSKARGFLCRARARPGWGILVQYRPLKSNLSNVFTLNIFLAASILFASSVS